MRRRLFVALALLAGIGAGAAAQSPSPLVQGPWKRVAPLPPGGPVDVLARLLATGLQQRHGSSAIVDN